MWDIRMIGCQRFAFEKAGYYREYKVSMYWGAGTGSGCRTYLRCKPCVDVHSQGGDFAAEIVDVDDIGISALVAHRRQLTIEHGRVGLSRKVQDTTPFEYDADRVLCESPRQ